MSSTATARTDAPRRRRAIPLAALIALLASSLVLLLPSGATVAGAAEPVRIMPLGDSITEGSAGDPTYRYFLWRRLTASGRSADLVGSSRGVASGAPRYADFDQDHDGHTGWRADQLVDGRGDRQGEGRLIEWARASRPDVVLLHIGTNDLRQCQSVASTVDDIGRIVATLRSARPGVAVAVAKIIPTTASAGRPCASQVPGRVLELNAAIGRLAAQLHTAAAPVVAVDQHTGFDRAADTTDGVHPDEGGDAKLADRWFAALGPLLGGASGSGPLGPGYWMLGAQGDVYAFGGAPHCGDHAGSRRAVVDLEPFPDGRGYWLLDGAARVTAFACPGAMPGRAPDGAFAGRLAPGERPVSLSARPDGKGYWVVTDRGRAVTAGNAGAHGDMAGRPLNAPVLDSVATPSGRGYWMVGADGGLFSFGDATFVGSMGGRPLQRPVMSMVPDPDGRGYWLVASDGGVFAFDAPFIGSMGGVRLNSPVSGMVGSPSGRGYLMVAHDGGAFAFGDVAFHGSLGADPPPHPIIAIAVR